MGQAVEGSVEETRLLDSGRYATRNGGGKAAQPASRRFARCQPTGHSGSNSSSQLVVFRRGVAGTVRRIWQIESETLMAGQPSTRIGDCLQLLAALGGEGEDVIIVGGQAVNLWAELYLWQEPGLARFLPFTSHDLDLHRPGAIARAGLRRHAAQEAVERDPFGKAFDLVEASFIVKDRAGQTLRIEALKALGGLTVREVRQGVVQVEYQNVKLLVLHPLALLKAKAHNLAHLDQKARQDDKHFRILLLCVRAFLVDLFWRMEEGERPRVLLDFLELTLQTALHPEVLRAARSRRLDLRRLLPLRRLARNRAPHIVRFITRRLPHWEKSLRSKLRAARPANRGR